MPFSAILGHTPVVDLLRRAVARGRVPQSLLFAGPEGVGKRAVAMALAQAVNCPQAHAGDACGTCSTCVRIARGQHSDVTVIDKGDEASIKIKAVRTRILETVHYRPFEAKRRVYVIDPADELVDEAQDALLKTLEEPPPAAILILVTAYPDMLRPTIQSRCRRLRFGLLSDADVTRLLVTAARIDPAAARVLAIAAGGSVSRALASERGAFEHDREVALAMLVATRQGVAGRLKSAEAFAKHGSDRRAREALGARLAIVHSLLRDLGAIGAGDRVALANADLEKPLRDLAPVFDVGRAAAAFAVVTRAADALDRNASPKIVADWTAMMI